jgi:hypothetical protein
MFAGGSPTAVHGLDHLLCQHDLVLLAPGVEGNLRNTGRPLVPCQNLTPHQ